MGARKQLNQKALHISAALLVGVLSACGQAKEELASHAKASAGRGAPAPNSTTPVPPPLPKAPVDVAAVPADAQKTASGLAFRVLKPGTGTQHPTMEDGVRVIFTGWTTSGQVFGSSGDQEKTIELSKTSQGWAEGLTLMVPGEKRRLWIPPELGYQGKPNRPQGMLVSDVELVSIIHVDPPDQLTPPPDAIKMTSGAAMKVLQTGSGSVHPAKTATVAVNVSSWTADGKRFASTLVVGSPEEIHMDNVLPAWAEALEQMVPGEKRRVWMPADLCPKDRKEVPPGPWINDLELVAIMNQGSPDKPATDAPSGVPGQHP